MFELLLDLLQIQFYSCLNERERERECVCVCLGYICFSASDDAVEFRGEFPGNSPHLYDAVRCWVIRISLQLEKLSKASIAPIASFFFAMLSRIAKATGSARTAATKYDGKFRANYRNTCNEVAL